MVSLGFRNVDKYLTIEITLWCNFIWLSSTTQCRKRIYKETNFSFIKQYKSAWTRLVNMTDIAIQKCLNMTNMLYSHEHLQVNHQWLPIKLDLLALSLVLDNLFLVGLYNFWTCNYACCIVMPFLKYYFVLFPLLGTS